MTVNLNEVARAVLDGPHVATVATSNVDGRPQSSVIFVKRDGDTVLFSTVKGRLKVRNMMRGGVAVGVVPELTKHPGAEDDTKSWQGEVDVGVRVCLKMCRQFGFEVGDLTVQFDDDADRGADGCGECGSDR
jgi:hypothetical protein